jgi:hypothetical protein
MKMNKELKLLLSLIIVIGGITFFFRYPQYEDYQYLKRESKKCYSEIENHYFGVVDSILFGTKLDDYFLLRNNTIKRN